MKNLLVRADLVGAFWELFYLGVEVLELALGILFLMGLWWVISLFL